MTKRVLRSFLYLDENIVDDYLAQFEGGIDEVIKYPALQIQPIAIYQ